MKENKVISNIKNLCPKPVREHFVLITAIIYFLTGIIIRIALRDLHSGDTDLFLLPWYDEIKTGGGFAALDHQVGDYNILYQTIIAMFTYLPIRPLYAYKLFSCIFDLFLAVLCARLVYELSDNNKGLGSLAAFGLVFLSPIVFIDSSWWAQCDAIYTFFGIAAVFLICRNHDLSAFCIFGISITFKLQAIFLLPGIIFTIFCRKKMHLIYTAIIPVIMIILSLPGISSGRSIADVFLIYFNQTSTYPTVTSNYPSVWSIIYDGLKLLTGISSEDMFVYIKYPAIILAFLSLAAFMLFWLIKKVELNTKNIIMMTFLLSYTCVIFLPSMHERYSFTYEILALITAFINRRTIHLAVTMYVITLNTYFSYFFSFGIPLSILAAVNIFIYVRYIIILNSEGSLFSKQPVLPEYHKMNDTVKV